MSQPGGRGQRLFPNLGGRSGTARGWGPGLPSCPARGLSPPAGAALVPQLGGLFPRGVPGHWWEGSGERVGVPVPPFNWGGCRSRQEGWARGFHEGTSVGTPVGSGWMARGGKHAPGPGWLLTSAARLSSLGARLPRHLLRLPAALPCPQRCPPLPAALPGSPPAVLPVPAAAPQLVCYKKKKKPERVRRCRVAANGSRLPARPEPIASALPRRGGPAPLRPDGSTAVAPARLRPRGTAFPPRKHPFFPPNPFSPP